LPKKPSCFLFCGLLKSSLASTGEFSQYSQTCVQRPPLGPEKCGRYSEVVVTTGLIVLANLVTFAWVGKIILYMKKNSFKYKTASLTLKLAN
jgi:hypothetical protein